MSPKYPHPWGQASALTHQHEEEGVQRGTVVNHEEPVADHVPVPNDDQQICEAGGGGVSRGSPASGASGGPSPSAARDPLCHRHPHTPQGLPRWLSAGWGGSGDRASACRPKGPRFSSVRSGASAASGQPASSGLRVPGPLQPARPGERDQEPRRWTAGLDTRLLPISPSPCTSTQGTHTGPQAGDGEENLQEFPVPIRGAPPATEGPWLTPRAQASCSSAPPGGPGPSPPGAS